MTNSYSQRLQLAAQGALQAIVTHGAESGYTHEIRIITEGAIFVKSTFADVDRSGGTITNFRFFEERIDIASSNSPLTTGYEAAFKNILSLEHQRGRCVNKV